MARLWASGLRTSALLTHWDERSAEDRAGITATAAFVQRLATDARAADPPSEEEILTMLQLCRVNAHGLLDPLTQTLIGLGLFPSLAGANHSCVPNMDYLCGRDGQLRVVAIRDVAEGEELTIAYTDIVTQSAHTRRATLQEEYFFNCSVSRPPTMDRSSPHAAAPPLPSISHSLPLPTAVCEVPEDGQYQYQPNATDSVAAFAAGSSAAVI